MSRRQRPPSARIYLRQPVDADAPAFLAAVRSSKKLHSPWVAPPANAEQFARYLERLRAGDHQGWLVCDNTTHELVGVINLTNIVLGLFRSGYLGYYAFAGHDGQGLMGEGMQAAIRVAFKALNLHRLEANIQPGNARSIALVRRCGFVQEGYSPRYLKIGGRWRDHERWALVR